MPSPKPPSCSITLSDIRELREAFERASRAFQQASDALLWNLECFEAQERSEPVVSLEEAREQAGLDAEQAYLQRLEACPGRYESEPSHEHSWSRPDAGGAPQCSTCNLSWSDYSQEGL